MTKRKILLITYSEFSGTNRSIVIALRRLGCEVLEVPHSLRILRLWPLYRVGMLVSAAKYYGWSCHKFLNYTPFAHRVHARVNQAILDRRIPIDAVISTASIFQNYFEKKIADVRYAILTDHVNLLSKQLPDFGYHVKEKGKHSVWNEIEGKVLNAQDHNFVLAEFVKRSMLTDYGVSPDKVTVVGAGPNLDLDAGRDSVKKDFHTQDILFVGRESERKGLPVLLGAFSKLSQKFPRAHLHVVGTEENSTDRIQYHGTLGEAALRDLYYRVQIFVLPSLREPFGIALLEAMWSKTACIGTTVGAIPEIIVDGHNGYLIEPGNEKDLLLKLDSLLSEPEKVRQMAENGYEIAREKYSWELAARKILTALFER